MYARNLFKTEFKSSSADSVRNEGEPGKIKPVRVLREGSGAFLLTLPRPSPQGAPAAPEVPWAPPGAACLGAPRLGRARGLPLWEQRQLPA